MGNIIGSNNEFPSVLVKEGTAPASPASGDQRLFIDSSDHKLKRKNSSGTVTSVEGATSPLTTKGDIWVYGSSDTRLGIGSDTQVLTADSAQSTGMKWAAAGGGGATVQYPALKPGTPTYDFAGASLDGAFSAHSLTGSFATTDVITQGADWVGSSVDMSFAGKAGQLYVTHSNGDFDFQVGGMRAYHLGVAGAYMIGIGAVDTSGNGVGVVAYTDGSCYLAGIGAWIYTGNTDSWATYGLPTNASAANSMTGQYWFRLKRVSGTWTGYASVSGSAWDKTFSTRSDSITLAYLTFGIMYQATAYRGRLTADYMDVAV